MASRDDHAASRRCLSAVLIAVLMTSVGSSNSTGGSSSSGSSCSCSSSARGHLLQQSPTSTTPPPHVWHPPLQTRTRCTATTTTAGFFHHHYRWRSNTLSSCPRPDGHAAAGRPWWRWSSSRAFGKHRTILATGAAARRRPVGVLGMADDPTSCDGGTVRTGGRSRSRRSDRHRALAAIAGGSEMREAEGAAAVAAAGAVERRSNGHDGSTPAASSSSTVKGSGVANPVVTPETYGEREGEGRGDAIRHPSMFSRGMAATERFFANDRRRSKARSESDGGDMEEAPAEARGFTGEQGSRGAGAGAAASVAAATAKLEGEQEARDQEGLRMVPRHVAFVMDGNGRWAASRNLPRGTGHVEGARRAGEAVEACRQLGVEFVTLYAFSTENWRRPEGEVSFLMDLMEKTLVEQRDGLRRNGIRLTVIGELDRLPERLRSLLREIQEDSSSSSSDGKSAEADSASAAVAGASTASANSDAGAPNGPPSIEIPAVPGVSRAGEELPRGQGEGSSGVDAAEGAGGAAAPLSSASSSSSSSSSNNSASSGGRNNGDDPGKEIAPPSMTASAPSSPPIAAAAKPPPPPPPPPPLTAVPIPTTMTLCLAISYGGRSELAAAARELAADAAAGKINLEDIDESALGGRLSTARLGIPDPDLVVRTSGESRLSNLLVWQSAYSELCVVGKAWPDFRRPDLVEAFRDFGRRRRRFGKTPEQIAEASSSSS